MTRTPWVPVAASIAVLGVFLTAPPATAAETVTVSGTVRDGSGHGWGLSSRVSVDGIDGATHSSPWDGRYRLELAPDTTYTVRVAPRADGYPETTRQVHTGSGDTALDVDVAVDADGCYAPGYRHTGAGVRERFDAGAVPAGWTVVDNLGTGQVWRFDDPGERTNLTGGRGGFAILDSRYYRYAERQDSALVSPVVDLGAETAPEIGFTSDFYLFNYTEVSGIAEVDLSVDGGTGWETVWRRDVNSRGPEKVVVPIPQAAGKTAVQARFRYHEGDLTAGVWWQLDDAYVGTRFCDPVPGGMATGFATDRNTGLPLVGATVRGPDGTSTTALATPDDPTVGDGYYALFVPRTGVARLTASVPKYQPQSADVDLRDHGLHRVDVSLAAGRISTAATVRSTQDLGETTTKTLTLRNDGTADATLNLTERPGEFELLTPRGTSGDPAAARSGAQAGAPLQRVNGIFTPYAVRAATGAAGRAAATSAEQAWTGVADYPLSISDNAAAAHAGRVYTVGGRSGNDYAVDDAYVYDPATTSWSALPAMPHARQAPMAGFLDGKLYVVGGWGPPTTWGIGGDPVPEVDVYDPATGRWTAGPSAPQPVAGAGIAILDDTLYVVAGCPASEDCGTNAVYRYTPGAASWERIADYPEKAAWLGCGAIEGVVYCTGGIRPRPKDEPGPTIAARATYSFDPGTGAWTRRADLPIDLWGSYTTVADGALHVSAGVTNGAQTVTNQGFRYDPLIDGWSALPNSTYASYRGGAACGIYKVGGGTAYNIGTPFVELLAGRSDCGSDRDAGWLSADRTVAITLKPGEQTQVRVRFDATSAGQPGTFSAKLLIRGDMPYPATEVDAEMVVEAPRRWGVLAGSVTGVGCDGAVVPLPGASVWLDGRLDDFTLPTDGSGRFARWLDSRNGPATMVVGLDGWIPVTRTVRLASTRTVTENVQLRQLGC